MAPAQSKGPGPFAADGSRGAGVSAAGGMTPFDDTYNRPDPRAYFRALGPWEYQTPHHAQGVFRRLLRACGSSKDTADPVTVLDICCSYGINAALLNHDLTLDDLYAHYTSPQATAMTTAELAEWDTAYYAAHRRPDAVRVVGLDAAPHAVSYARAVGLLDEAFAENLETAPAGPDLLRAVRHARLITLTGGAGFLSPRTFQALLDSAHGPVWVAAFVLRTGAYDAIAACLETNGLTTEKATATFPQRRFTSAREQQYAIDAVTAVGENPHGKESEGYFHTTLYLSRPATDTARHPLATLVRG
ncbi:hypothetical protein OG562_43755 [Streptomyces sp. NBC_01275]|uniref:hypothetical protein n=1 Tax=Streptomyces sp. NBC_01275 TaxID=2903807 RepID=UPI002250159D|nr:hypothetical protein [Streptomyces sp. NBC_01275]MCX4767758.1 hypothetical protein [Streptomyces sp. NBC_01275]